MWVSNFQLKPPQTSSKIRGKLIQQHDNLPTFHSRRCSYFKNEIKWFHIAKSSSFTTKKDSHREKVLPESSNSPLQRFSLISAGKQRPDGTLQLSTNQPHSAANADSPFRWTPGGDRHQIEATIKGNTKRIGHYRWIFHHHYWEDH